jgi:hypothetical protein
VHPAAASDIRADIQMRPEYICFNEYRYNEQFQLHIFLDAQSAYIQTDGFNVTDA